LGAREGEVGEGDPSVASGRPSAFTTISFLSSIVVLESEVKVELEGAIEFEGVVLCSEDISCFTSFLCEEGGETDPTCSPSFVLDCCSKPEEEGVDFVDSTGGISVDEEMKEASSFGVGVGIDGKGWVGTRRDRLEAEVEVRSIGVGVEEEVEERVGVAGVMFEE
jgi:hypothetical protein